MNSAKVLLLAVCAISAFSQATSLEGSIFVIIFIQKEKLIFCPQMAGLNFWEENTSPAH